jgi:hypothetical protein
MSWATLPLLLASCGWYTNVPAQIHVQSIVPATVGVVVTGANSTFTNPTVTAVGEYGSIGATYTVCNVTYADQTGHAISNLSTNLAINLRVEGATLASYPKGAPVQGTGNAVLPIVNKAVLDYYSTNKPGALTATVGLSGTDDAHYPVSLTTNVPISFSGQ